MVAHSRRAAREDAPMAARFGAIETGGTTIRCAWGEADGTLRDIDDVPTGTPAEAVDAIRGYFAGAPAIERAGLAAFGPIDVERSGARWGTLLDTPKPGWSGARLGPDVERALGVPVLLDTDVNAAALAEHRWGAARDADPVAYVTAGTGIGLGVLVGGRPLHGLLHSEGGHVAVRRADGDDFPGCCPFHGDCWEGMAAGPAIAARWDADPAALPDDHPAWALEAQYLAQGIATIVLVLAPRRVVLGGGVGTRAGMLDAVRDALPAALGGYPGRPAAGAEIERLVVAPGLGARAGLAGALALGIDG
jgi:fructokinase